MKFFWKIFFAILFLTIICVTLSGYMIIHSNFQAQLASEADTAQEYGEIVFYSLANEFSLMEKEIPHLTDDQAKGLISDIAHSISIGNMKQKIAFGVVDEHQNVLFSSLPENLDKSMIPLLENKNIGWRLKEKEGEIYVQTMYPANFSDRVFYIEMIRNVTHIFTARREQYQMMVKIILGMIVFAGMLTFFISKLLLRRIVTLTETTRNISKGNLSQRVLVKGEDEIALLSENFNYMADCLEEKMEELKDEAQRKELFVGAFSHELKTPLTSIIGYSDLLLKKELNFEERQTCARYIFTEGKRLEKLSMRMLELIVLKNRSLDPKPTAIAAMMEEVKTVVASQLERSDIHLICDMEEAMIPMEPELMKTVFINVIDNARKAIGQQGSIFLSGRKAQGVYTLSVRDTGKGMKQEDLSKITDAFYVADKSRAAQEGGSGLGLAISNEILKLHGFLISFQSTVGEGTVVTVEMEGCEG